MSSQATLDLGGPSLALPFRPRARILQLLGDELIGSARLAVFELVKNAYDADARMVRIVLADLESANATIVVEDDGDGMTLETIRDIWLVPGHDHRARQRAALRRTHRGRLPLGEKGLGRFAAHKLGNRIEVVSRAHGSPECVVSIDWKALIRHENLSGATVQVATRAPVFFSQDNTGTRITISDLREKWTRGEVRRLQRQITSITSPFERGSDDFSPRLEAPGHDEWVADVPDAGALMERAPWHYRFCFHDGRFDWRYHFRGVKGIKLAPREQRNEEDAPLLVVPDADVSTVDDMRLGGGRMRSIRADASLAEGIGTVKGEFYVFDRDPMVLAKLGEPRLVKNYLDENGGIRIYRDGMRVYNYGERGEDWLGIDLRRVNAPARMFSRNIVIGAVGLSLESSVGLREKTNREGFIENAALERLKKIVLGALTPFEAEREKDKSHIRRIIGKAQDRETKRIKRSLRELRDAAYEYNLKDELEPFIFELEREYNELRDSMLRAGLSGMGLAVLFHEVEHGVRGLSELVETGAGREAIRLRTCDLVGTLDGFADLLRKGKRRPNSLKNLIRRVQDINRVRFRKHNVRLECPALEDDVSDATPSFVFGLALGALNNLLDNAFYWLQVRWPGDGYASKRAIHISINLDLASGPSVVIADTGPGLQDEPEELVRPFFSRRPEGMGLGLYYAQMVMELGDGRLAFPDRSEADVPETFDGAIVALVFPREDRQ